MIVVNGEPREGDGTTIAELLTELGVADLTRGVAVAVNGEIVPQGQWASRRLGDGDRLEALTAMQGG